MLFTIAFRNILRHRRRTILSAITIAAGMLVFIFMNSLLTGADRAAIDNLISLNTAALKIQTQRYQNEQKTLPLTDGIANADSLRLKLLTDKRVKGATPRTRFLGQLSNYADAVPVIGIAIDERTDSTVFSLSRCIEGSYFSGDNRREIILGKRLAANLGVTAGDFITLYALTRYESRNADEFKIVGLLNTTDPALNRGAAYITLSAADDFIDREGLITELDVAVRERINYQTFVKDVKGVQQAVRRSNPGCAVDSYLEIAADYFKISRMKSMFGFIFMGFILLIAGVGIFNTVFMSVFERIREIGVLRAHGFKPAEITRLFLLEGVFTGVAGSTLGLAAGCVVNVFLVIYGYPIDKVAGDSIAGDLPVYGTIYGQWNIGTLAAVFLFGIAVAVLAGIIPARKAGSIEVNQALRFN